MWTFRSLHGRLRDAAGEVESASLIERRRFVLRFRCVWLPGVGGVTRKEGLLGAPALRCEKLALSRSLNV